MSDEDAPLSRFQQVSLVLLRTLVGWHFLYEGYFKLWRPAWSPDGVPLAHWSSAGYLRAASGPFAGLFRGVADSPWLGVIDVVLSVALVAVGLSLILGLLTEAGCIGALALLALFYVSSVPITGMQQPGAEGAYLLVNKNLVEAGGVLVLLAFGTGRIAGLDRLWRRRRHAPAQAQEATS
jgi:thiosulfate dehydrogenase [quinone] large subunit